MTCAAIKKTEVENVYEDYASEYLEKGVSPLPVKRGGRGAEIRGWPKYALELPSAGAVDKWKKNYPEHGISLVMGTELPNNPGFHLVGLDVDQDRFVEPVTNLVFSDQRNTDAVVVTKFGSKGLNIFAKTEGSMKSQSFNGADGTGTQNRKGSGAGCFQNPSPYQGFSGSM